MEEKITGNYAIVFAGGGAKGAWQIGVWKALKDKFEKPAVVVAGTSVGALNAALYALSPTDTSHAEDIWTRQTQKTPVLSKNGFRTTIYDNSGLTQVIQKGLTLGNNSNPRFQMPLYVCAYCDKVRKTRKKKLTNETGKDLCTKWLLASSAIPHVFPKIKLEDPESGELLGFSDGGCGGNYSARKNAPVEVILENYGKLKGSPEKEKPCQQVDSIFLIALSQTEKTYWEEMQKYDCKIFLIMPEEYLGDTIDFSENNINNLINKGEEAGKEWFKRYTEAIDRTELFLGQTLSLREKIDQAKKCFDNEQNSIDKQLENIQEQVKALIQCPDEKKTKTLLDDWETERNINADEIQRYCRSLVYGEDIDYEYSDPEEIKEKITEILNNLQKEINELENVSKGLINHIDISQKKSDKKIEHIKKRIKRCIKRLIGKVNRFFRRNHKTGANKSSHSKKNEKSLAKEILEATGIVKSLTKIILGDDERRAIGEIPAEAKGTVVKILNGFSLLMQLQAMRDGITKNLHLDQLWNIRNDFVNLYTNFRRDLNTELSKLNNKNPFPELPSFLKPPRCNSDFVGRDNKLKELDSAIQKNPDKTILLYGYPGNGKRELVVRYANLHEDEFPGGCYEIDASGKKTFSAVLSSQLEKDSETREHFGVDEIPVNEEKRAKLVIHKLKDDPRKKLVLVSHFNDIDFRRDPSDIELQHECAESGNITLIVTAYDSRDDKSHISIEVNKLLDEEGLALLKKYCPDLKYENVLKKIVTDCGGNAWALTQLKTVCQEIAEMSKSSGKNYFPERYNIEKEELRENFCSQVMKPLFDKFSPKEQDFLIYASLLPTGLICGAWIYGLLGDDWEGRKAADHLIKRCLFSNGAHQDWYEMLNNTKIAIQVVAKDRLQEYAEKLCKYLAGEMGKRIFSFDETAALANTFYEWRGMPWKKEILPLLFSLSLNDDLGDYLTEYRLFDLRSKVCNAAEDVVQEMIKTESEDKEQSRKYLASLRIYQGHIKLDEKLYDDALKCYKEAEVIRKEIFEDANETYLPLEYQATVWGTQAKGDIQSNTFKKAMETYEICEQKFQTHLDQSQGHERRVAFETMARLHSRWANTLNSNGIIKEAEEHYCKAVEYAEKGWEMDKESQVSSVWLGRFYRELGLFYKKENEMGKALPHLKKSNEILLSLHAKEAIPHLVAHRGESADEPENTVPAYKLAWENGCCWAVETDVFLTKDHKLICCHDEDTKRTTGVDWLIGQKTLAELQTLNAGFIKGKNDVKLPSLQEVFKTVPENGHIFVEIKFAGPYFAEAYEEARIAGGVTNDQVTIISFDTKELKNVRQMLPDVRTLLLVEATSDGKFPVADEILKSAQELGVTGVDLEKDYIDAEYVKKFHDAKLEIHVWTVDTPDDAKKMCAYGVDSITTNRSRALFEEMVPEN